MPGSVPRTTGTYETTSVAGENVEAFVPHALPPGKPPLQIDAATQNLLQTAQQGLAQLDLAGRMVPSLGWLTHAFVRKEAVISSQIEGTQASLTDLLTSEITGRSDAPPEDVEEICNYLDALRYARKQLASSRGLPLSMRLLNGAHKHLLAGTRGKHKQPGKVRRSQNWIGGTRPGNARFVPPPPHRLPELLTDLEKYLHDNDKLPPLVRAGLLHAQFETIHPYLDGNGRVGRLLIALCLEDWQLLNAPLLYLSLFFKRHQQEYYDRLGAIRTHGDWEGWIAYFLEAVGNIATEAVELIRQLFDLVDRDRKRVVATSSATAVSLRLFEALPRHPIVSVNATTELCATTKPTASKAIGILVDQEILIETSGKSRDRIFCYRNYLDLLKEGTDL